MSLEANLSPVTRVKNARRMHRDVELRNMQHRILSPLLDRLTDDDPTAVKEPVSNTLITQSTLRKLVLRDLKWLFNCIANECVHDFSEYSNVSSSTLNYGVLPLAGMRMSEVEPKDIQRLLAQAIINFEPRILPDELEVKCISEGDSLELHNILSIEIRGRLWCLPYPLAFIFRTDVDLENGYFELKDVG